MNKRGGYVVVCYNNEKEVITFIKDVLYNQKIDLDIYVVVNSSLNKDAFIDLNTTKFLYPEKNLGYLGALNYASEKINFQKYSFVCFSNTDLTFDSTQLLNSLCRKIDDAIALISPRIINGKRNQNPLSLKRPSKIKVLLVYLLTFSPIIYFLRKKLINSINFSSQSLTYKDYDCYALHGSFLMFSVKHIHKFNFIHHQLLFGEEIYIAEQCRNLKIRSVFSDTDIIYHNENSTTSLLGFKNKLRYIRQANKYILNKYY